MPVRPGPLPSPEVLAGELAQQPGLPLRPETVRGVLAPALSSARLTRPAAATEVGRWDPAWAFRRLQAGDRPLTIIDHLGWVATAPRAWDSAPAVAVVRERLWRHAVTVAIVARRVAEQQRLPDPEQFERVGLAQGLGLWAVAASRPEELADLFVLKPVQRRTTLRSWLGQDITLVSRRLAQHWGGPADLVDACWLAEPRLQPPAGAALAPQRLGPIRQAYQLAEATRWSLWSDPVAPSAALASLVARVEAEVEEICHAGFLAGADPFADELARHHARLLLEQRQQDQDAASGRALLAEIAGRGPSPVEAECPTLVASAREAWLNITEDLAHLDRLLGQLAVSEDGLPSEHSRAPVPLRSRLESLAEFAGGAGHELNNPLAVILGRAQILLGRTTDPEANRALRAIIAQAQRAHRILRDLMYVARPPAPRPRLAQPLEIVRASLRDLRGEAETRGLQLELQDSGSAGARAVDPDALRHLTDTLVFNALEASATGGTIRVGVRFDPDRLTLQVEDDGRGLSVEQAEHLLDPFFCGRQAGRGLGLGLPRVARFLDLAGGQLSWEPVEDGSGTVFTVELPIGPTLARPSEAGSGEGLMVAEAG